LLLSDLHDFQAVLSGARKAPRIANPRKARHPAVTADSIVWQAARFDKGVDIIDEEWQVRLDDRQGLQGRRRLAVSG